MLIEFDMDVLCSAPRNLDKSGESIVKIDAPAIKARMEWLEKLIK